MNEYFTPTCDDNDSIQYPAVEANNFELKPGLISMVKDVQFSGLPHEDPNAHLKRFQRITKTVKYNGFTPEAIRPRLFTISLQGKTNFFENRVAEYQKAGVMNEKEGTKFSLDEDF